MPFDEENAQENNDFVWLPPEAQYIPVDIFNASNLFNKNLDAKSLSLMQIPQDNIQQALAKLLNECTEQQLQCHLLALVFRKPGLSGAFLLSLCSELNLFEKGMIFAACVKGDTGLLVSLAQKNREAFKKSVTANHYQAFYFTAKAGHGNTVNYLLSNIAKEEMLLANKAAALVAACEKGHLHVVEYIFESASTEQIRLMLQVSEHAPFIKACVNGHISIASLIISKVSSDEVPGMIAAQNYAAFWGALQNSHKGAVVNNYYFNIINLLIKHLGSSEEIQKMLANSNVLPQLIKDKKIEAAKKLIQIIPDNEVFIAQILHANNNEVFFDAAEIGALELVKLIVSRSSKNYLDNVIKNDRKKAFLAAAASGYMELFDKFTPDELPVLCTADNFLAFRKALQNSKFDIAQRIIKVVSAEEKIKLHELAVSMCQSTLLEAARSGDKAQIQEIISIVGSEENLDKMLTHNNGAVLTHTHQSVKGLFENREVAMNHEGFIDVANKRLQQLYNYPHKFNPSDARLHLYDLRRRLQKEQGSSSLGGEVYSNICQDVIKKIAHEVLLPNSSSASFAEKGVVAGQPNELLRIAIAKHNDTAINLLLAIPTVRKLARENLYYVHLYGNMDYQKESFASYEYQLLISQLPPETVEDNKKIKFLELVTPLKDNYTHAFQAPLADLILGLTAAAHVFFALPATTETYKTFKARCISLLESAGNNKRFAAIREFVNLCNPIQTLSSTVKETTSSLAISIQKIKSENTKLKELYNKINALSNYGEKIGLGSDKGTMVMEHAKHLCKELDTFVLSIAENKTAVSERHFKKHFKELLHSKDKEMQEHRQQWMPITANILIALTGIGLIALIAKALLQKQTLTFNNTLFFAKTNTEQLAEKIDDDINRLSMGRTR